jgi:hypothetical protein
MRVPEWDRPPGGRDVFKVVSADSPERLSQAPVASSRRDSDDVPTVPLCQRRRPVHRQPRGGPLPRIPHLSRCSRSEPVTETNATRAVVNVVATTTPRLRHALTLRLSRTPLPSPRDLRLNARAESARKGYELRPGTIADGVLYGRFLQPHI